MRTNFKAALTLLAVTAFGAGMALAQQGPPPGGPGGGGGPPRGGGGGGMAAVLVESKAFEDGGIIPLKYSFYGTNTQPDFRISNLPATTQSVALIFHDLDVASGGNPDDNLHWVAWNIPVSNGVATLEEGKLPEGALGGGLRGEAYFGPGAPNGPRYHHYVFEFYALNAKLDLPATARRPELWEAMKGKVVGKSAYVGRFRNDTNAPIPGMGGGAGGPPRGGPGGPGGPPPGGPGGY